MLDLCCFFDWDPFMFKVHPIASGFLHNAFPLARAEFFCAKKEEVDPVRGMKPQPKLSQVTLGKETSSNSIRLDLSDVAWHNSPAKFEP